MPSILLFGATGLMGSHLVVAIKKAYPDFPLTVYIRDTDPAVNIYLTNSVHVDRTVHGDFSESEKISKVSAEHDIVINAGSSWDVPLSKAIVTGLKSRLAEGKSKATLIHVSGTGNFADGRTDGRYAGPPVGDSKVWNDDNEADMKLVNKDMLNGGPDVEVIEAGKSGEVNTYIIFPSGVYGASVGPKKSLGIIQLLYKLQAEEVGFVPYIGEGTSLFQSLHVEDFPPFVLKVIEEAMQNPEPKGSVYSRFYIITSQATTWIDTSNAFARLLHAQGVVSSPEAKSVPLAEAGSGELPHLLQGASMLLENDRAKRLGYKPLKEGLLEWLENEVQLLKAGKQ